MMFRNVRNGWVLGLLVSALAAPLPADESDTGSLGAALRAGDWSIGLRYRFEEVYDDAVGEEAALASTLRTAIGYRSGSWHGLRFQLEGEDVRAFDDSRYNNAGFGSSANGVTDRPVIADPEGSALQRANLSWESDRVAVVVGRDEINLGDQRYVGNVGWRQHHQSFDAATITVRPNDRVKLFYGYLDKVRKINRGVDDLEGHVLRGELRFGCGQLTLYGLELDYDDAVRSKLSSSTWGAEWAGARPFTHVKLVYELEYARQRDAGANPLHLDAGYYLVNFGLEGDHLSLRVGQETLDGSARNGQFNTPLATLHKFNGWADKFLVTPRDGLVDASIELGWKRGRAAWSAGYHDFEAASGGADYGTEYDAQLLYQASKRFSFGLKAADYEAEGFGKDSRKLWFWLAASI